MEQVLIDFIQEIISVNEIPFHQIDMNEPRDDWDWFDLGLRNTLLGDDTLKYLPDWCQAHQGAYLYHWTDPFQCNYASLNLPGTSQWLFMGPILFEEIKGERFDQLFQCLGLPERLRVPMLNHYYNIKLVLYHAVFETFLNLIADYTYGKEQYQIVYCNEDEAAAWHRKYCPVKPGLNIPENPFLNVRYIEDRYDTENSLIRAVSSGNEALALACLDKMQSLMLPQRLSSELRDMKSYTITVNTLLRKAAETSGVHPYHIDNRSNSNIQQMEQLTSVNQCRGFQRKITRDYCQLVKEYNLKDYSMPVRKAITYINVDLSADLSLKSLAGLLNVNASYLSSLFKKETGTTLTEYVNNRRIGHAQKLLLGTSLPVQSISLQCGISDMYYFSRMFKRITGLTPRAFREKKTFPPEKRV